MFYASIKVTKKTQPDSKGLHLICLRVSFARKSKYFSLNMKSTPENWNDDTGRLNKSHPDHKRGNDMLLMYESKASDIIKDMERSGDQFTFEKFKERFDGNPVDTFTIAGGMIAIANEFEQNGQPANHDIYNKMGRFILAYNKKAGKQDLTPKFLAGLEAYLIKTTNMTGGGMSIYFRSLRAACGQWVLDGVINENPFAKFKIGHMKGSPEKKGLRKDELNALLSAPTESKAERLALDIFSLSFYLWGANMADIGNMKKADIETGRFVYKRQKTKKKYSVPIPALAVEILERYNTEHKGYVLPIYNDTHDTPRKKRTRRKNMAEDLNKNLKLIAARAGVPTKNLSIYSARHTFATILKDSGTDIYVISELLGHSDIRTTSAYLQAFKIDVLDDAANKAY
jgi:integrase/recombinase XerD